CECVPKIVVTMLDSERLFDECVRKCGGVRVTDLLGAKPQFENADYYFERENIVSELKSLQKDFISAPETEKRMHALLCEWVEAGKIPTAFGEVTIRTDDLPKECAEELFNVFQIPLERVLRKAESQIVTTKRALGRPDA